MKLSIEGYQLQTHDAIETASYVAGVVDVDTIAFNGWAIRHRDGGGGVMFNRTGSGSAELANTGCGRCWR